MDPARITVVFSSPREVLKYSRSEGKELSIFFPCGHQPPLNTPVSLGITFAGKSEQFELQGVVTYIRTLARGLMQPQGIVVTFVTGEQRKRAAELIAFCAGRPVRAGTAGAPRTPVTSRCIVRVPRGAIAGYLRDISNTGAFVAAALPRAIREGAEVLLQIRPFFGLFGGRRVRAKVVWTGQKYGEAGFGVRFTGEAEEIRRAVAALS